MSSNPKKEIFAQLARVGGALSSPARITLLELLAQADRTVEDLATLAGLTVANTSQHLQKLRQAGLVDGQRDGVYVHYRLAGDQVVRLMFALSEVGKAFFSDIARVMRLYMTQRDMLEPVPAAEALERSRKGLVTIVDVRPPEEFAAGHVPGAINIPIEDLERRIGELPKRKEVIAYCRGPYCLMSFDAVKKLRERGLRAKRLENGLPEWRAAGFPVEH
jgi:rhodanese-related sulfurtransferase/DNA-binding MarR family transcriptional regulator